MGTPGFEPGTSSLSETRSAAEPRALFFSITLSFVPKKELSVKRNLPSVEGSKIIEFSFRVAPKIELCRRLDQHLLIKKRILAP